MKNLLIIFTILISFSACKTKEISQNTSTEVKEEYVSLDRGGCYGTCASYKITINKDGSFKYDGKSYVTNLGKFQGEMSSEQTNALFKKVEALKWNEYPDEYPIDNYDFPQFKLEYSSGKIFKKIEGNSNAAKEIIAFNKSIDELTENLDMEKTE